MQANLEKLARQLWHRWGDGYAMFTRCSECGELKQCRGRKRKYMVCLECFDLKENAR